MSVTAVARPPLPALPRGTREIALFACAYALYSLSRHVVVGDPATARDHARWIIDLEASVSLDVERAVQDGVRGTALLWVLNHAYLAAQLVVLPGALVLLHRRRSAAYARLRDTVLATWLLALPVYALFPVAPPRLADMGMVDTITSSTGVALDSKLTTSFYNELAAVPSLHCGFALAVSAALAVECTRWWTRALALAWTPLVALSVVATGNHFLFDVVAGFVITVAGFALGRALSRRPSSPINHPTTGATR